METETTLLDYGYGGPSPKTPSFRNSDIDFRDVFGGPPRRSSIHEMMRYSFTEGADSGRRLGPTPSFRDPWAGAEEKPVFGGGGGVEVGGNRRRGLREDFFVDIFGGSESPSSTTTPRKQDRDVFSASSPVSRPLSPAWPLPPRAEGFVGLSSGPPQFSLPDTLSKSVDSPPRNSHKGSASNKASHPHSPKISVFGFASKTGQVHDESRSNGAHYRPSPLSQQPSLGREDSLGSNKNDNSDNTEKDVMNSPQFHFSIYKWASKGVPLMMPLRRSSSLRSEEKGKTENSISNERVEAKSEIADSEDQLLGNFVSKVGADMSQPVENEVLLSARKQEAVGSERNNVVEDINARATPNEKTGKSPKSKESLEKGINVALKKVRPELKPLHAFFEDKDEEGQTAGDQKKKISTAGNGEDVIDRKSGRASRTSKVSSGCGTNAKDFEEEKLVRKSEEAEKVIVKGSPRRSGDGSGKKRSKGKVKEFIKIFNQEAPPAKPKTSVHPQDQSFEKKENGSSETTKEAHVHRNAMVNDGESVSQLKLRDKNNKVAVQQKESQKEHSTAKDYAEIRFNDTSSRQKDKSVPSTASVTEDAIITDEDAAESPRTFFTIKELPPDDNKQAQPTDVRQEFQEIDAKIRRWSRGKEGNIRSLLSTLQYVLWPGSGWKPVPLVDIIEGSAVKRSYQRALLCLHPDKLQQKGAASDQKYIAEQVFDILQEAWTHFNTLGDL